MFKRGDSATNITMFITTMIAVFIGLVWVVKHNYPFSRELEQIDQELIKLQIEFGAACNSPYYESKINPAVEYGLLTIRDSEICINSNLCNRFIYNASCQIFPSIFRCRPLICSTGLSHDFNLKKITYLLIKKNETFEVASE